MKAFCGLNDVSAIKSNRYGKMISHVNFSLIFRFYLGKLEKDKANGKEYVTPEKVFIAGTMTNWRAVEMIKPKGDLVKINCLLLV